MNKNSNLLITGHLAGLTKESYIKQIRKFLKIFKNIMSKIKYIASMPKS